MKKRNEDASQKSSRETKAKDYRSNCLILIKIKSSIDDDKIRFTFKDKTFGMKNKKGAKGQKIVQQITKQVQNKGQQNQRRDVRALQA